MELNERRPCGRSKTCVVPSKYLASNGTADDSPAIISALAKCSKDAVIAFCEGLNYNIFNPTSAKDLSNVEIRMRGNLHLPQNITAVQKLVNISTALTYSTTLYWIALAGPSIDYIRTNIVTNGWIESYGQAWWDLNPVNGTGTPLRPHLFSFNTTNGSLRDFNDAIIDAYSTTASFPFNTDRFDVTGTNIKITNSVIFNGDDSIAVHSGSHNVLFEKATIGYQTHGMSIGSLGQNQASFANISNITFNNVAVINGVYAAPKNITWSNSRSYNVSFLIFVTQMYFNQGSSQIYLEDGTVVGRSNNSTVVMKDFTWTNFTGTINTFRPGDGSCVTDPCWYNAGLPDLKHTEAIIVECNTNSSCTNFVSKNIELFPQDMEDPTVVCFNAMAALNPKLGFDCRNGTFIPM
ncbi:pectin lyase fold/virulence factor [Hyaloscypha sp. PMI_1271]|nr:pectin lyase fold/virulence factor [Hyaloscypha sp. PMI_1271]